MFVPHMTESILMPNRAVFKQYLTGKEPVYFVPGNDDALK